MMDTTDIDSDAAKDEWVMLVFRSKFAMAKFVNALPEKIGSNERDEYKVGINAINVRKKVYEEIKSDLGPVEYKYRLKPL